MCQTLFSAGCYGGQPPSMTGLHSFAGAHHAAPGTRDVDAREGSGDEIDAFGQGVELADCGDKDGQ